jgi:cytoskeletal protein RodZ
MAEQDQYDAPLTPLTVGERLRAAREAAGLNRADVAARTKIAERHLGAIEEDRFDDLASSTYAVGFARAYARAVGLDEAEIARLVRGRLDAGEDEARPAVAFEPGDPARIPTPRPAGVVAVIVAIFLFWRSYYTPAVTLPDLTKDEATAPVATAAPAPLPSASVGVPLGVATSMPAPTASGVAPPAAVSPAQAGVAPQARPSASPRPAATPTARPSPRPTPSPSPRPSPSLTAERPAAPAASPAPAAAPPAAPPAAAAEQASTVSQ